MATAGSEPNPTCRILVNATEAGLVSVDLKRDGGDLRLHLTVAEATRLRDSLGQAIELSVTIVDLLDDVARIVDGFAG